MTNAALQRKNMVESQIRPSDVTDRRITAAMTVIPREAFLPARLANFAYSDQILTIVPGREVLAPCVLARLIQLAEIADSDSVLVISEAGYAAAIVAQLAAKVTALLPDEATADLARTAFNASPLNNVVAVVGSAASGWPQSAPYDIIVVEGGVEQVPDSLKAQLRDGGRLVAIDTSDRVGHAIELHKQRDGIFARRESFQATALPLPGFTETRPAFVF
ncbi:MAG: protein-L-isoaspartate O-methyltransferase [Hyphomicrobium sp.]|uniref:protein-L-isoaspartate O-methyltransferase family protein n=1 Tax=Hyphomicrobium sp. TaxID=82 RepID=UPI0039E2E769